MTSLQTDLTIRRATTADAALLAGLNQQLIRDEGHRNSMSLPELEYRMVSWLSAEYSAIVAQCGDAVLGYALFREECELLYLRQLFVRPEARRQGIGRALLDRLTEHECHSTPQLRIEVLVGNRAAIDFWHALGFQDYCITMERPASMFCLKR